jgi:hypothetical protein
MQKETRVEMKYINTVRSKFTAIRSGEIEVISNGTSRIRYTKKNESMEYAPSAYSCRSFEQAKRPNEWFSTHLVNLLSFKWV